MAYIIFHTFLIIGIIVSWIGVFYIVVYLSQNRKCELDLIKDIQSEIQHIKTDIRHLNDNTRTSIINQTGTLD